MNRAGTPHTRGWRPWRRNSEKRFSVLRAIESRLAEPADSSTRNFQKMLVVVVSLIGSVATVFNALPFFTGFLSTMGWTYLVSAAVLFLGALLILWRPSLYEPVTFIILTNVLVIAAATQVLSGGFRSGLLAMPWTLLAPLGAVLTLRGGLALIQLVMFVATAVAVAWLEPFSRSIAPFIIPSVMLRYNVTSLTTLGIIAAAPSLYLIRQVEHYRIQAESLLSNVLPAAVAERLKAGESRIADNHDDVTILFADIAGFTQSSATATPEQVVTMLDDIFSKLDDLAVKHGLEKIKTVGDAYMAASGLGASESDPNSVIEFALDLQAAVAEMTWPDGEPVRFRVGIHSGPAVAGVIGHDRLMYDLWGDAVNMAARMESTGPIGGIQVSETVKKRVEDRYRFEERHEFPVKGKGMTVTYTLNGHGASVKSVRPDAEPAEVLPTG